MKGLGCQILLSCFAAFAASGDPVSSVERSSGERLSLEAFVAEAQNAGPALGEARARVEGSEARELFAQSKAWPAGQLQVMFGPAPDATGNAVEGRTEWSSWGPLASANAQLIIPVYTFGALSSVRAAAAAGTQAEKALLERDRWKLRTEVAEFYYGYQLAFELGELASSLVDDLGKALRKVESIPSRARDADKLRVYFTEAQVRVTEARRAMDQFRVGMAWKLGRYPHSLPRWDRSNLEMRSTPLNTLENYQAMARTARPEILALSKSVEARLRLVDTERAQRFPSLFVGAKASHSWAPGRVDQRSPFVFDPANETLLLAGVGLQWNLGFFEQRAKVAQVRADWMEAQAKQQLYAPGVLAEVEKNYLELKQLREAAQLREEGARSAKRVFRELALGYALGTSQDVKALLEALGAFAQAEKTRLESIHAVDIMFVKLEQAVATLL